MLDYSKFIILKKQLEIEKTIQLEVLGSSMLPLYRSVGERINVEIIHELIELKRFDIIVFWQNEGLIVHYFWKINSFFNDNAKDPTIITRPLNPITAYDHPIHFNQLLGIVRDKKIGNYLKFKISLLSILQPK